MQRRVRRADGRLCSWNTRSLDFLRPLMSVILTSSAWFIQLSTVNYEPREGGLNSHRRSMMSLLMYLHFSIYISGLDKHHVTDLNKVWKPLVANESFLNGLIINKNFSKSFWPKGVSQSSVHYLNLSTFKVWRVYILFLYILCEMWTTLQYKI